MSKWEDANHQLQDFFENPIDIVNGNLIGFSNAIPRLLVFDSANTIVGRNLSEIQWQIQFISERGQ